MFHQMGAWFWKWNGIHLKFDVWSEIDIFLPNSRRLIEWLAFLRKSSLANLFVIGFNSLVLSISLKNDTDLLVQYVALLYSSKEMYNITTIKIKLDWYICLCSTLSTLPHSIQPKIKKIKKHVSDKINLYV